MGSLNTALVSLAVILGGALVGVALRKTLPERHLAEDIKDLVRLGTGLIGTIAALVLGLLIAAANSSFGTQSGHVQHIAADIILLDQLLVQYGQVAKPVREELRQTITPLVERIWRENQSESVHQSTFEPIKSGQDVASAILRLAPQNEAQRVIKDRATQITSDLAQTRFLLFEQSGGTIPLPFLIVLIFWLSIIFMSFGMFSRLNIVSGIALTVFALFGSWSGLFCSRIEQPVRGTDADFKRPAAL
jgi:hypothetical protein